MKITFGKHEGKTVEELVLKQPDYIIWILNKDASGSLLSIKKIAKTLLEKFDAKPLQYKCTGKYCKAQPTRATVYLDNIDPHWWCEKCDPYQLGANSGKLQIIRTYMDIIQHVNIYCSAKKKDQVNLLNQFAKAKGLPARVSAKARTDFFN